ncbi:alkanesulfonate monooxygenase SsuD/methylene tetrahydromethanopterin reductase-like flavin-dependent oxidoreductase (luciferase family) [Jatrophihabitans sp. GAS493]|uniref:LLM class flavin-dependent oxidoreductase n=1 Tax=Jatrophihabitans sp. GAS493 TaxID=1907575 RepID=UPI000BB68E32|nr:LLM class flavin-dependent oxidoreductase [Jatrophihabitans sp. GAS493]SOD71790.1 alkanesulfonate monooxygenase SsuD/methylene tetrahydromethanopterin reductase-like flavin-dependent oxidoreductase (luciferase family) [Jatrophihabitans sp. GAS493]
MTKPFAPGTISLGLSAVGGTASEVLTRMTTESRAAVAAGFDGVTISEHHAGFPRYVSSPLAISALLLARLERGWAVAAPTVLPLRNPIPVAEDLAWLAAAYPGRVGAAFVAGYQRRDFEVIGVDFDSRHRMLWEGVAKIRAVFEDESPLAADPAIAQATGASLPLLVGIGGPVGAHRAGGLGLGILATSLRPPNELRAIVDEYREAGGAGPAVLIRRIHVGQAASGFAGSMEHWRAQAPGSADWLQADESALLLGSAEDVAERLVSALLTSGCTALNIRIDAYATRPELVAEQIELIGSGVLPMVRAALTSQMALTE